MGDFLFVEAVASRVAFVQGGYIFLWVGVSRYVSLKVILSTWREMDCFWCGALLPLTIICPLSLSSNELHTKSSICLLA